MGRGCPLAPGQAELEWINKIAGKIFSLNNFYFNFFDKLLLPNILFLIVNLHF
jgi:hypothetical protein